ncbi:amidohydrolase family protein [Plantactinospora endophytica]|uniref:Amidohydrolase n=1 Tax=Plantactinospora endophytica TaxID=673535 RepID=A0ABQ4E8Y2_9ACTN|nr:amidohydrolase family protein [Plantactinospora endophytica]GIG91196.1 amidohydrolase [Plantactinospora endophytica]
MTTKLSRRGMLVAGLAVGATAGTSSVATAAPAAKPGGGSVADSSGPSDAGTAFTSATVIDPASGQVRPDTTVLVRGDTITEVGRSGQVRVPAGATVVDLRGRFLIPGLADMHTHGLAEQVDPALCVANGVTTVREMSGTVAVHDWRRRIEAGTLLGPRYTIGSRIVDGAPTVWDPMLLSVLSVADAAQARQAVRQVVAEGADFVKVYSRLSPPAYRAVAAECRRLGVAFAGHCPDAVPVTEAAELGQASVEHMFSTAFDTSSEEARIRARIAQIRLETGDYSGWFKAIHPVEWTAAHTYSPAKARRVFDRLAGRRTRQVPTLAMHYWLDNARALDLSADPRARYLPAPILAGLQYALDELYLKDRSPDEDAEWAAMFGHRLRMVGELHRAGVPIMVGTDVGTCGLFPGFSVHDELRFLVDAGLTPMAALHAATAEPASFLGARTGRIARNRAADLVVLGANPLTEIGNTTRIEAVVVRGRYLDRAALDRLLRGVAEAAAAMSEQAPEGTVAAVGCPCHGGAPAGTRVPAAA